MLRYETTCRAIDGGSIHVLTVQVVPVVYTKFEEHSLLALPPHPI